MTTRAPVTARLWDGESRDHWLEQWRIPELRIFAAAASTNDEARNLALQGAAPGTVVIADHQWAGRGRKGRAWRDQPEMSLLLSLIMRPLSMKRALGPLPLRVGMAVCTAIQRCAGLPAQMKWPNDILTRDGRKLAGILCEASSGPDGVFVVAGIGINVGQPDGSRTGIAGATSILIAAGQAPPRGDLAGAILDQLRPFEIGDAGLDENEMREFRSRDALRGRVITVDGRVAGIADGVQPDGALKVKTAGGTISVRAGTVRVAAPREGGPSGDPANPQQACVP